ncbi:VOC family protein [Anaerobacillus alkaliphilus]|uniref:VOC family protein n=1 Tax=Anaerobacillus alkaliphilus TaxID=1548597 RepID=A0A4Q0VNJ1_9BACI|nr:VOC family protein [Anaerobacillus alkaliphilus]RXI96420.1 VOC family protein [Anaerobacillus alkaliphilus]
MKLYRVILPVSDIEEATVFYRKLLNIEGKRVSTGRHYFDCDGTILACFDPKADGDNYEAQPNPDYIYISVANLEEIFEKVCQWNTALVKATIKVQPWGEKSFYMKDPYGNPICFVDEKTVFRGLNN